MGRPQTKNDLMEVIQTMSNDELFQKNVYDWVGGSTIGSYFVSVTSSHYDWAMKKIKAHRKMINGKQIIPNNRGKEQNNGITQCSERGFSFER